MSVIHDWHSAHQRFTCRDSQAILDRSATDHEFYDGLDTILLFMTGMIELWPAQALRMTVHCVDRFLPDDGGEQTLTDGKRIAMDRAATSHQLREQLSKLRHLFIEKKSAEDAYKHVIENVLLWRLWKPEMDQREVMRYFGRISVRLTQYLNRVERGSKNGEERIMQYLKEIYPFESWLRGIQASVDADNVPPDYEAKLIGVRDE